MVLGGGVVVGGAGLPFLLSAQSNLDSYDSWIGQHCPEGCLESSVPQGVLDLRGRARTENIVAVSLFSVGGALAAGGIGMLVLNQPRTVPAPTTARLSATPFISPKALGLLVGLEQ
jgi:hypothetical protein